MSNETKGDLADLPALLERWRRSRSARVADLIDRLGAPPADHGFSASLKPILKAGPAAGFSKSMRAVAKLPDDPRLTTAILGWLAKPRWSGSSAAEGWDAMFARLVELRDTRALGRLREMMKKLPPFQGVKHSAWMATRIAETADALAKATAKLKPAKDDDLAAIEATLPPVPSPPPTAGTAPVSALAPVFAAPDDDDVRRVAADALLEHGDPWGELIQLQLLVAGGEASAEQIALAAELIKNHGKTFAGPIAKISNVDTRLFEKGFLVQVRTSASMVGRRDWEEAIHAPHWATVRRVDIDLTSTPKWWIGAWTKGAAHQGARELVFCLNRVPKIVCTRADPKAPWRVTEAPNIAPAFLRSFAEWAKALPKTERARIEVAPIPQRDTILAVLEEARAAP